MQICLGDPIWCNRGKRHWHGATDKTAMHYIAINESVDGKPVDWFEPVSDETYLSGPVKKTDIVHRSPGLSGPGFRCCNDPLY